MNLEELVWRAFDDEDNSVKCTNDAAVLILILAEAVEVLESCLKNPEPDSPFTEENTKKIRKHLVKAGELVLGIDEPKFSLMLDLTLEQVSELDG